MDRPGRAHRRIRPQAKPDTASAAGTAPDTLAHRAAPERDSIDTCTTPDALIACRRFLVAAVPTYQPEQGLRYGSRDRRGCRNAPVQRVRQAALTASPVRSRGPFGQWHHVYPRTRAGAACAHARRSIATDGELPCGGWAHTLQARSRRRDALCRSTRLAHPRPGSPAGADRLCGRRGGGAGARPAAGGVVVTDEQGRSLARRAQYLGPSTRLDATARALLDGLLLAVSGGLEQPLIRLDDAALVDALRGTAEFPPGLGDLSAQLRAASAQLPGLEVAYISPGANPARAVALEPLADWLPERARRAEELRVEQDRAGRVRGGIGEPPRPTLSRDAFLRRGCAGRPGVRLRRLPVPRHPLQAPTGRGA